MTPQAKKAVKTVSCSNGWYPNDNLFIFATDVDKTEAYMHIFIIKNSKRNSYCYIALDTKWRRPLTPRMGGWLKNATTSARCSEIPAN